MRRVMDNWGNILLKTNVQPLKIDLTLPNSTKWLMSKISKHDTDIFDILYTPLMKLLARSSQLGIK